MTKMERTSNLQKSEVKSAEIICLNSFHTLFSTFFQNKVKLVDI